MSLWPSIRDHAIKWVVGVLGGGIVAIGAWLYNGVFQKIVMDEDLKSFAIMIGEEVRSEIEPLSLQTKANTTAICIGRRATLKAAMRDLRLEIAEMDKLQYLPGWTERDGRLLAEWTADYEDGEEELATLVC